MRQIIHFIRKKVSSERFDEAIVPIAFVACSLFVFFSATFKLARLEVDEKEIFFGMLLISCLSAQLVVGGLLCEIYRYLKKQFKKS